MKIEELEVKENDINKRLDVFISEKLEGKSRSYVQGLIEEEKVKVNEKLKKSNYKLKLNDLVIVDVPEVTALEIEKQDIPLDILYEDNDVIVINKPQDMVVHPAPGNYSGTLVNALLYHCNDLSGINGVVRPGIVHRIDKDTSGILVIAKNDNAHNRLAEQLKEHSMTRTYYALVEGKLKEDSGTINAPIGRHPVERIKMAVVKNNGKESITHYKVLERFNHYTLVKCNLETGRTHQIRVHMAYIGHPLVGDTVYGFKKQKFKLQGQVLHAKELGFIHPTTNEYMKFISNIPKYFEDLLGNLRKSDI
ncbi:pseudouridine synthase, RluA family protein [Clostridium argentinense CDC 2741]|uniref:Pseudouridine synthase n=1 Tax=Clostridium argentinense CDC 2741 TaxID=1418104 RepID=A0A0C1UHN0_9CLOT|nr:RluA family pseudouridine synthase [Clostridium argentinense]ARC85256.1 RNA pseudouridine synthase [Clostridium argentinense]KIE46880.1 pseudouridine synthase, RluA family protein [Clostridium argentinense CDC 2741]NFF40872.1 RluA family pseudouridine synthase [Clostridium argentinense]NFP51416.1 RluA family pseudouridine synthase [Clostridium argentinense]NFP73454.1 RluA family pseudouridine synthase [Clostridium argentinense]